MTNISLVIIDPQNDFCDPNGTLYVSGADKDMENLSRMLHNSGNKINNIYISLDMHKINSIFHPNWWIDNGRKCLKPFTIITYDDVISKKYTTSDEKKLDKSIGYLQYLKSIGSVCCIWPYHCLIGSLGATICPKLQSELNNWEKNFGSINYIIKGLNPWTEHFSVVKAIMPLDDKDTQINNELIKGLEKSDIILWSGEALSHCLSNSIRDVIDNSSIPINKMVLLRDTCSNVSGFEKSGNSFVNEMKLKGLNISNSKDMFNNI